MACRFVYGPVPSRRLGRSLGISPIPLKTCTYDCVYCQLGRTSQQTIVRRDFFAPGEIAQEIRSVLASHADDADYVTFVGEGEPTLCRSLGSLIQVVKKTTELPVAVITNGSLLHRDDVRRDLVQTDVVMPSLDAADVRTFRQINRPHGMLRIADVVTGMIQFRRMFDGLIWVEVMLVRGVNDGEGALLGIRRALEQIEPDRVFVNFPIRPPAEGWAEPPDAEGLVRARAILGEAVFIDQPESGTFGASGGKDPVAALLAIVRRHPLRRQQVQETLASLSSDAVESTLRQLERAGKIQKITYRGETYYAEGQGRYHGR